jgi:hypothetical protein
MKKITLIALLTFTTIAFSQDIKFGAKGGLNLSSLSGDYPDYGPSVTGADESSLKNKSVFGFHIGGFLEYSINEKLSIQPEILLSQQGSQLDLFMTQYASTTGTGKRRINTAIIANKLTYINLPIMLKYKVFEKLNIEFGPQIGYLVNAKVKVKQENVYGGVTDYSREIEGDNKESFKGFDFGVNFGTSYDFNEHLFVEVRYNLGLSKVYKPVKSIGDEINVFENSKNSVLQLSVGYRFN